MRITRSFLVAFLMLGLLATAGCGRGTSGFMPAEDTFYLSSPDDAISTSTGQITQALCASQSVAYQTLLAWIAEYNDEIKDRIDTIKLLARAAARQLAKTGELEWTVSALGRTITLDATEDATGAISYSATFEGPNVAVYTFLSGNVAAGHQSGSWDILKPDGSKVVEVTWSRANGTLTVNRSLVGTDRSSSYVRTADTVTITFHGANHEGLVTWNRQTKNGSLTVDSQTVCWEHIGTDYCTATCP